MIIACTEIHLEPKAGMRLQGIRSLEDILAILREPNV